MSGKLTQYSECNLIVYFTKTRDNSIQLFKEILTLKECSDLLCELWLLFLYTQPKIIVIINTIRVISNWSQSYTNDLDLIKLITNRSQSYTNDLGFSKLITNWSQSYPIVKPNNVNY